ncbi:MAG: hypothetical protein KBH33_14270, partial [Alicycliphilus sp.]|nr:hypothetical protein [Alicycliphilus sp.]
ASGRQEGEEDEVAHGGALQVDSKRFGLLAADRGNIHASPAPLRMPPLLSICVPVRAPTVQK